MGMGSEQWRNKVPPDFPVSLPGHIDPCNLHLRVS